MKSEDASSSALMDNRIHNRRIVSERRKALGGGEIPGEERRKSPRRKVERRRMIDPTTCERDYSDDEIEFMKAMDEYKRKSGRMFPTWSEVLEVVRALGYSRPGMTPGVGLAAESAVN
ncbi:MAG: hypothetical protein SH850_06875 [Planctomycetaceae bacterium]|nr:hypothetical protein [Planctomycetaceae bacterium]